MLSNLKILSIVLLFQTTTFSKASLVGEEYQLYPFNPEKILIKNKRLNIINKIILPENTFLSILYYENKYFLVMENLIKNKGHAKSTHWKIYDERQIKNNYNIYFYKCNGMYFIKYLKDEETSFETIDINNKRFVTKNNKIVETNCKMSKIFPVDIKKK